MTGRILQAARSTAPALAKRRNRLAHGLHSGTRLDAPATDGR